jgi:hypothetical protein
MKLLFGVMGLLAALGSTAFAADLGYAPSVRSWTARANCHEILVCRPEGCVAQTVCGPRCPDRYSCAPLYGAYGPWGGRSYLAAYTISGWGYRPR